jgi:hypothetical protein
MNTEILRAANFIVLRFRKFIHLHYFMHTWLEIKHDTTCMIVLNVINPLKLWWLMNI